MSRAPLVITSASNPRFRHLLGLEKSRTRRQEGLTTVEGLKEIEMALEGGMVFRSLFCLETALKLPLYRRILHEFPETDTYQISHELFSKTAYRESTGGMIAVLETRRTDINSLNLPENPLVLVISGVEKPGNIGAMLRTADAAALDAVICCDLPGDLFNPNTIRSSLGTVFTVPVCVVESAQAMDWLKKHQFTTYCTHLHQAVPYHLQNYSGPSAIIMGTEAEGVSDDWVKFSDLSIKIPMMGRIDSMNVSVAAAVVVFEAKRQRGFREIDR